MKDKHCDTCRYHDYRKIITRGRSLDEQGKVKIHLVYEDYFANICKYHLAVIKHSYDITALPEYCTNYDEKKSCKYCMYYTTNVPHKYCHDGECSFIFSDYASDEDTLGSKVISKDTFEKGCEHFKDYFTFRTYTKENFEDAEFLNKYNPKCKHCDKPLLTWEDIYNPYNRKCGGFELICKKCMEDKNEQYK